MRVAFPILNAEINEMIRQTWTAIAHIQSLSEGHKAAAWAFIGAVVASISLCICYFCVRCCRWCRKKQDTLELLPKHGLTAQCSSSELSHLQSHPPSRSGSGLNLANLKPYLASPHGSRSHIQLNNELNGPIYGAAETRERLQFIGTPELSERLKFVATGSEFTPLDRSGVQAARTQQLKEGIEYGIHGIERRFAADALAREGHNHARTRNAPMEAEEHARQRDAQTKIARLVRAASADLNLPALPAEDPAHLTQHI